MIINLNFLLQVNRREHGGGKTIIFSLRGMQVVKSSVVKIQMHVAVGIKSHSTGFGYFDSGITFSSRLFSYNLIQTLASLRPDVKIIDIKSQMSNVKREMPIVKCIIIRVCRLCNNCTTDIQYFFNEGRGRLLCVQSALLQLST